MESLLRNLKVTRLHSIAERWSRMNAALKAEGRHMGVIGRASDLAVKEVKIGLPPKKFWVTYFIDQIGLPFALEMVETEGMAVKTSTRMVAFAEVADWMSLGDFIEVDRNLAETRIALIRLLGPLRPFLEA